MTSLISFGIYMVAVFAVAIFANRAGKSKSFVSEYFLGSKSIGLWAFAFTYAATSASGGSFMGFPSLIYTHGWVLAWWIAGYMVVPIIALGLLAKRINQVGRIAGAITIPELLRRRFENRNVGNLATLLVVFFMFFYLMAQFKAGAQIMATLMEGVPVYESAVAGVERVTAGIPWVGAAEGDYLLCLLVFAVSVIAYTTFGGFRAVVWTDVMQGVVMGLGVVIMLVLTLAQVGGLGNATKRLGDMTPPQFVTVIVSTGEVSQEDRRIPRGEWVQLEGESKVIRLKSSVIITAGETESEKVEALKLTTPDEINRVLAGIDATSPWTATITGPEELYAYGDGKKGVYMTAPGPSQKDSGGFLGVMLALSFFAFWTFSGAGQPSYMVRQMAFRDTITLRRSIVMVAVYFTLIYFPLVIIFTCARVLLPGMEIHPDRVMPEMAALLTSNAGMPWLAGLLIAAPFAAVMSSVDSFLLLVSSGIVRDVYQESINPKASEKQVKKLSYLVTVVVGVLGLLAVMHPPQFLQHLIVFASAGLGACFLMPMIFALYWPRTTSRGVIAGMLTGGATVLVLYLVGFLITREFGEYLLLGLHPFVWAVLFSSLAIYFGSLSQKPVSGAIRLRYFGKPVERTKR
jgi:Na+/proline symporter